MPFCTKSARVYSAFPTVRMQQFAAKAARKQLKCFKHSSTIKPPHRARRGDNVKKEIRKQQKELGQDYKTGLRFESKALEAIQEAAEAYLVKLLADANKLATKAKRVTVKPEDIQTVRVIRGEKEE